MNKTLFDSFTLQLRTAYTQRKEWLEIAYDDSESPVTRNEAAPELAGEYVPTPRIAATLDAFNRHCAMHRATAYPSYQGVFFAADVLSPKPLWRVALHVDCRKLEY